MSTSTPTDRVTPSPPTPSTAHSMPALMSACVMVVVAMVAAINLALPKLSASSLHPSSTALTWIVDAYILVFGCLLIPAGALGDRIGRKGVLVSGLIVFAVGTSVSAAAPGVAVLIAGRVVSGLGAALVMPATLSLLLQVTPTDRRAHAIATWTGATGAAGAIGNLGGGLVLQWLPWQGLFLVVGPLAVVLALVVASVAPRGVRHPAALDLFGASLLTAAILALLFGIIEGPARGWTSQPVLASFATAVATITALVLHARRRPGAIVDPQDFRVPELRRGTLGVGAVFFGLFALFFVNAQYLQYAKGYSPLVTGVAILPLPIGMLVVSRRSITLGLRLGTERVVTAGMLLVTAGLVGLSFATASTSYPPYALALLAVSTGMGLSVPSLSTGIMRALPPSRAGMGSGLNSAAREIGAALGIAVVGTVLTSRFEAALPSSVGRHGSTAEALRAASALGNAVHAQAVRAFTDGMGTGLRVIAAVLMVATMATNARRAGGSAE